jgi:hypothetical protein
MAPQGLPAGVLAWFSAGHLPSRSNPPELVVQGGCPAAECACCAQWFIQVHMADAQVDGSPHCRHPPPEPWPCALGWSRWDIQLQALGGQAARLRFVGAATYVCIAGSADHGQCPGGCARVWKTDWGCGHSIHSPRGAFPHPPRLPAPISAAQCGGEHTPPAPAAAAAAPLPMKECYGALWHAQGGAVDLVVHQSLGVAAGGAGRHRSAHQGLPWAAVHGVA